MAVDPNFSSPLAQPAPRGAFGDARGLSNFGRGISSAGASAAQTLQELERKREQNRRRELRIASIDATSKMKTILSRIDEDRFLNEFSADYETAKDYARAQIYEESKHLREYKQRHGEEGLDSVNAELEALMAQWERGLYSRIESRRAVDGAEDAARSFLGEVSDASDSGQDVLRAARSAAEDLQALAEAEEGSVGKIYERYRNLVANLAFSKAKTVDEMEEAASLATPEVRANLLSKIKDPEVVDQETQLSQAVIENADVAAAQIRAGGSLEAIPATRLEDLETAARKSEEHRDALFMATEQIRLRNELRLLPEERKLEKLNQYFSRLEMDKNAPGPKDRDAMKETLVTWAKNFENQANERGLVMSFYEDISDFKLDISLNELVTGLIKDPDNQELREKRTKLFNAVEKFAVDELGFSPETVNTTIGFPNLLKQLKEAGPTDTKEVADAIRGYYAINGRWANSGIISYFKRNADNSDPDTNRKLAAAYITGYMGLPDGDVFSWFDDLIASIHPPTREENEDLGYVRQVASATMPYNVRNIIHGVDKNTFRGAVPGIKAAFTDVMEGYAAHLMSRENLPSPSIAWDAVNKNLQQVFVTVNNPMRRRSFDETLNLLHWAVFGTGAAGRWLLDTMTLGATREDLADSVEDIRGLFEPPALSDVDENVFGLFDAVLSVFSSDAPLYGSNRMPEVDEDIHASPLVLPVRYLKGTTFWDKWLRGEYGAEDQEQVSDFVEEYLFAKFRFPVATRSIPARVADARQNVRERSIFGAIGKIDPVDWGRMGLLDRPDLRALAEKEYPKLLRRYRAAKKRLFERLENNPLEDSASINEAEFWSEIEKLNQNLDEELATGEIEEINKILGTLAEANYHIFWETIGSGRVGDFRVYEDENGAYITPVIYSQPSTPAEQGLISAPRSSFNGRAVPVRMFSGKEHKMYIRDIIDFMSRETSLRQHTVEPAVDLFESIFE